MVQELWGSFPRLLEQNINGLLDGAYPSPTKAFQLYKSCKNDDLWSQNFDQFSRQLETYFALPKALRKKSAFDNVLDRPMDQSLFSGFHLTFRTGVVAEDAIINLASWAHNLMRVSLKTATAVISLDVMTRTLKTITTPAPYEKDHDIEFEDFCSAWKTTVTKLFGNQHDQEVGGILREIRALKSNLDAEQARPASLNPVPLIYLTQTELDWTTAVREAAVAGMKMPKYPLSKGPAKQALVDLERVVQLYEIVQVTTLPELIKHRENIRITILDRCGGLLGLDTAAAAVMSSGAATVSLTGMKKVS